MDSNFQRATAVIASEAKQSIAPRKERMDCFVALLLAMTWKWFLILAARGISENLFGRQHILASCRFLEIEPGLDCVDPGLGTGFVRLTAGRAGHADGTDERTAGLDHQSAGNNDRAGQVTNSGLHHAGLTDAEELARAVAEGRRGPCFAGGGRRRMTSGQASAQHHLGHAEAIDDGHGRLIATLPAIRERSTGL